MKIRPLIAAAACFCLGAATFWAIGAHTHWLSLLDKRTEFRVVTTSDMEWSEGGQGGPAKYFIKYLYKDANSHQVTLLLRYPAGQMMPPHTHSHGHGMYVLSGKLVTHRGSFGPGTFVWFPANEVAAHGASPDEDVVVLFFRHEDFDIKFVHPSAH